MGSPKKRLPTRKRLRELFYYRDGSLYRKTSRGGSFAGTKIGCSDGHGYLRAGVDGQDFQLHQLVWAYHFGGTRFFLDHINQDKTDNRIENLRLANKARNSWHVPARSTNTTGYKGVYFLKNGGRKKFWAYLTANKKRHGLGCFEKVEDAAKAYNLAAKKYHGEFAWLNSI